MASDARGLIHQMTQLALAYLAGVIDSDGCILIEKRKHRDGRPSMYMAKIIIGQVDPEAVELAHRTFGGNIHIAKPAATQIGQHERYIWAIVSKAAVRALLAIRPHLRIKGDRADNCFELDRINTTRAKHERPTPGRSRPAHISEALEACYLRGKDLNTRPLSPRRQPTPDPLPARESRSPSPSLR